LYCGRSLTLVRVHENKTILHITIATIRIIWVILYKDKQVLGYFVLKKIAFTILPRNNKVYKICDHFHLHPFQLIHDYRVRKYENFCRV
jgi:hypothetical protein